MSETSQYKMKATLLSWSCPHRCIDHKIFIADKTTFISE